VPRAGQELGIELVVSHARRRDSLLLACGAPSPASSSAGQPAFDCAATRVLIEEQNRRVTAVHVAGDTATIDAMFTEDAQSYPPGADGRDRPAGNP
jgi:hypothetical protein